MHTLNLPNNTVVFYNGDFSGDVKIKIKEQQEIVVPFNVLKAIVAEEVRNRRIAELEEMNESDLLQ